MHITNDPEHPVVIGQPNDTTVLVRGLATGIRGIRHGAYTWVNGEGVDAQVGRFIEYVHGASLAPRRDPQKAWQVVEPTITDSATDFTVFTEPEAPRALTRDEAYERASQLGIKGRSKMGVDQLRAAVEAAEQEG